jgi:hypothetical protein
MGLKKITKNQWLRSSKTLKTDRKGGSDVVDTLSTGLIYH